MNKLERMYRIDALLQTGKSIPLARMVEETERSAATLKRDIQYMRDFFEAPILYDRLAQGYRYDPDVTSFELPGLWFNQAELYALRIFQEVTDTEENAAMGSFLLPVRERLDKGLQKLGYDPALIAQRIQVMPLYYRRLEKSVFPAVCKAIFHGQVLDICYHARTEDEVAVRRIHPQKLLQYQINWYIVAFCELRKELRTFSIERICIKATPDIPLILLDTERVKDHIESSFGIFGGKAKNIALLRFFQPNARWVQDEIWHKDQKIREDGDTLLLSLPYNSSTELVREILRQGPGVKVEGPESLRQEVVAALKKTLKNY